MDFICIDARDYLRTTDKKLTVLILSHILEYLDDPKLFLQQFKDYFRYIYIEVPDFEKTLLNNYRHDLNLPLIYTDSDHVSEFDRDEIKQIFEDSSLKILQSEYVSAIQRYWCEVSSKK